MYILTLTWSLCVQNEQKQRAMEELKASEFGASFLVSPKMSSPSWADKTAFTPIKPLPISAAVAGLSVHSPAPSSTGSPGFDSPVMSPSPAQLDRVADLALHEKQPA